MFFLLGEVMFCVFVFKDCYVIGSLCISFFSFFLFEYEKCKFVGMEWRGGGRVWLCYVLKGKKEEFFFVLVYDIFSYVERKLRIL